MRRKNKTLLLAQIVAALVVTPLACSGQNRNSEADQSVLREYAGIYQWADGGFLYLQLWSELAGSNQLTSFDESGELRTLYRDAKDSFFAGPGAAVPSPVESRISFQRDRSGRIAGLTWQRNGLRRIARPAGVGKREDVTFSNGAVTLAGTLFRPPEVRRFPAIVLVHASGAMDREYVLPFAWFLIPRGIAVLAYDKRGVGQSTGDWQTASFEDLASDVLAAVEYLKTRSDIDPARIGLLGWSQAGWVMPLAVARASEVAFLISISGAGVTAAETTIDQAQNEMRARGMRPEVVEQIVGLMRRQYEFARTGRGWDEYLSARHQLVARLGRAPETFPATSDDPYWDFIRRLYFYDPGPTLRRLKVPTLALFGELDNNILPEKNRAAWESALRAAGNSDYTLLTLSNANHLLLEAEAGSNSEMPSLKRFVPEYFTTVTSWLADRFPRVGTRE